jgi:putative membrane protein
MEERRRMAVVSGDVKMERLSRYLVKSPSWPISVAIIVILGFVIDGASLRFSQNIHFFGTWAFTLPSLAGFIFTPPFITVLHRKMTWNRSALLALSCDVFAVIIALTGMVISVSLLPLSFAISLGFMFSVRLLALAAMVDYRTARMVFPALIQSVCGLLVGITMFDTPFGLLTLLLLVVFGVGTLLLIWVIERPLHRAFNINGLSFLNSFIAHLADGSKNMEDFFREIGEEVYVPQVSLFFRKGQTDRVTLMVPNVHPGPLGEVGGGNLPRYLQSAFPGLVMVAHGTATHDFNLVAEDEIEKIVATVRAGIGDLRYKDRASRSFRHTEGAVSLLWQVFGDTLLMVSTRSPQKTEDIDFGIGIAIMAEGHRTFPHVAFVDAHNCFTGDISVVLPGTLSALEYQRATNVAIDQGRSRELFSLETGSSQVTLPYKRVDGFGDQGIETLVVRAGGQTTAYILIDGNNIQQGVREKILASAIARVDEAEVMTTDSHVVNTVSGKNPVGLRVPAEDFLPFVMRSVEEALADLSPAEVAGQTVLCEKVKVFGSQRMVQMASTVNAMVLFIPPLSIAILMLAFLLSVLIYLIII